MLQGCKTWILQNSDGQINPTHSVSAGLDYAAIGPEHAYYRDLDRIKFANASDEDALKAFRTLSSEEGILPAPKLPMASLMLSKELRRCQKMKFSAST